MSNEIKITNVPSQEINIGNTHEVNVVTLDGTFNYEELENKPQINGVELSDNTTLEELGIQSELQAGENIEIVDNVISVKTAPNVEKDNTKPITSAAVYTEVGNINVLLQTI